MSDHNACLCLSGRDELFLIDLRQVLYFEADDHYANVYYANGTHFLVPHGLSYIDKKLAESVQGDLQSVRGDLQSPHLFPISVVATWSTSISTTASPTCAAPFSTRAR